MSRDSSHIDFNPRPLAGATVTINPNAQKFPFQSTPPRGGDDDQTLQVLNDVISIHAPSRGRHQDGPGGGPGGDFNPRPLAGATPSAPEGAPIKSISIHAPSRGRPNLALTGRTTSDFNPRPLAGATISEVTTGA